jgi:hypothetical protein
MRDESNLIPVKSDVNQFLSKEKFMLDTANLSSKQNEITF